MTLRRSFPVTADEWPAKKGVELDRRLKRFARRLQRGELEEAEFRDDRLQVSPVKGDQVVPPFNN